MGPAAAAAATCRRGLPQRRPACARSEPSHRRRRHSSSCRRRHGGAPRSRTERRPAPAPAPAPIGMVPSSRARPLRPEVHPRRPSTRREQTRGATRHAARPGQAWAPPRRVARRPVVSHRASSTAAAARGAVPRRVAPRTARLAARVTLAGRGTRMAAAPARARRAPRPLRRGVSTRPAAPAPLRRLPSGACARPKPPRWRQTAALCDTRQGRRRRWRLQ